MRKNTTVKDPNKKSGQGGRIISSSQNSNDSTPAAIESGLGNAVTTNGTSNFKNIEKTNSEKTSKDQKSSSITSQ